MIKSMTGFASAKGAAEGWSWAWDVRAVNARGLDLRTRLPDWIEGLDQSVRAAVGKVAARGAITVGLKMTRDAADAGESIDAWRIGARSAPDGRDRRCRRRGGA